MTRQGSPVSRGRRHLLAALAGAVLAVPALLRAHGGHTHTVRGTITEIGDTQITIKQTDGKAAVIRLNEKTAFLKGEQKVDRSALVVGQRIVAEVGDGKPPLVASSVKLGVTK